MRYKQRHILLGLAATATLVLSSLGLGDAGGVAYATIAISPAATAPASPVLEASVTAHPSDKVGTAISISTDQFVEYGQLLPVSGSLSINSPSTFPYLPIYIFVDGVEHSSRTISRISNHQIDGYFPAEFDLNLGAIDAGEHTVQAKFKGYRGGWPTGTSEALPSESEIRTVTVTRAAMKTTIAAPTAADAFASIDVTATLASARNLPEGLLPDGGDVYLMRGEDETPIASAPLAADHTATFTGVDAGPTDTDLWVKYLGTHNHAPSESARSPLTIAPLSTSINVELDSAEIRAGETTHLNVTVANETLGSTRAPAGRIKVFVGDEEVTPVGGVTAALPQVGNDTTRFSMPLSGADLGLGTHGITVTFEAEPGFKDSEGTAGLTVLGVPTQFITGQTQVTGALSNPPVVQVTASQVQVKPSVTVATQAPARIAAGDAGGDSVSGTGKTGTAPAGAVQAFVGGTPLGGPVPLPKGEGDITLSGLGVGAHEVILRFTPSNPNLLPSIATVTAVITGDEVPGPEYPDPRDPVNPVDPADPTSPVVPTDKPGLSGKSEPPGKFESSVRAGTTDKSDPAAKGDPAVSVVKPIAGDAAAQAGVAKASAAAEQSMLALGTGGVLLLLLFGAVTAFVAIRRRTR